MPIPLLDVDSKNTAIPRGKGHEYGSGHGRRRSIWGVPRTGKVHRQNHAKFTGVSGVRLSPEKFAAPGVFGWRCWHHRWAGE
jgi:hypothetical protein